MTEIILASPGGATEAKQTVIIGQLGAITALLAANPGFTTIMRAAGEDLHGHRLVVPNPGGEAVEADVTSFADFAKPIWLTVNAWDEGQTAKLVTYGLVEEVSWDWEVGEPLYLGAEGKLTQVLPEAPDSVFSRQVGVAVTPSSIFFNPEAPILLDEDAEDEIDDPFVFFDDSYSGFIGFNGF